MHTVMTESYNSTANNVEKWDLQIRSKVLVSNSEMFCVFELNWRELHLLNMYASDDADLFIFRIQSCGLKRVGM